MGKRNAAGHETERGDYTTDPNIQLVNSIAEMIDNLPPLSPECCIYRVPKRVRDLNKKAYTPQVVSIGPLHRGKTKLQVKKEHKLRYLDGFLVGSTSTSLTECASVINGWEERIRRHYAESFELSSNEFVEMILLDATFVIEAVRRWNFDICQEQSEVRLLSDVQRDLILLENQLPFFVLEGLFDLAYPESQHSFLHLAFNYLSEMVLVDRTASQSILGCKVNHFVDLMRICHLPLGPRSTSTTCVKVTRVRTVTELDEAGMKFKRSFSSHLLDIQYSKGELRIPQLRWSDWTESVLRNILALEQCHYPSDTYIAEYIFFMDNLIDTNKDVDLLAQNGIIENELGDSSIVAAVFNNLTSEMLFPADSYYFADISTYLKAYYEDPRHKWKATLKRQYFSTPWRTASTIAAFILLLLTFIQTVSSFL